MQTKCGKYPEEMCAREEKKRPVCDLLFQVFRFSVGFFSFIFIGWCSMLFHDECVKCYAFGDSYTESVCACASMFVCMGVERGF